MAQYRANGSCASDAANAAAHGKNRQRRRPGLALRLAVYVPLDVGGGASNDRAHTQAQQARSQPDVDVEPATGCLSARTRLPGGPAYVEISAPIRPRGVALRQKSLGQGAREIFRRPAGV